MGGTNEPSNIIKLTIEEHAEAHKKLYEQYGNEYDRIAWQTLSGQITNAEATKEAQKQAGIQTYKSKTGLFKRSKEEMQYQLQVNSLNNKKLNEYRKHIAGRANRGRKCTDKQRENISLGMKRLWAKRRKPHENTQECKEYANN